MAEIIHDSGTASLDPNAVRVTKFLPIGFSVSIRIFVTQFNRPFLPKVFDNINITLSEEKIKIHHSLHFVSDYDLKFKYESYILKSLS